MENQQTPNTSSSLDNFFNIAFDESTRSQVRKAAQWARIDALCTFISYGVSLIVTFFNSYASISSIIGAIISVGIGVWINYYLYHFATSAAKGMDAMDSIKTNEGFNSLRVYFKIFGIILIIALCFVALIIPFALLRGI